MEESTQPVEHDPTLPRKRGRRKEPGTIQESRPKVDTIPPEEVVVSTSGIPIAYLDPQDLEDVRALLAWFRERRRLGEEAQTPGRELVRQTYHVEQRWIE